MIWFFATKNTFFGYHNVNSSNIWTTLKYQCWFSHLEDQIIIKSLEGDLTIVQNPHWILFTQSCVCSMWLRDKKKLIFSSTLSGMDSIKKSTIILTRQFLTSANKAYGSVRIKTLHTAPGWMWLNTIFVCVESNDFNSFNWRKVLLILNRLGRRCCDIALVVFFFYLFFKWSN